MTREEFTNLWGIAEISCTPDDAMPSVTAGFEYQGDDVFFYFDGYTESDVYDLGYEFFNALKEKLDELDSLAKEKISELDLNWNDVELKLSELRFSKYEDNMYHHFALTYDGGEEEEEDDESDGSFTNILMIHICFDEEFNFAEGFVEPELVD